MTTLLTMPLAPRGGMPPKDVPATSLYSLLSQAPRPFRVVDFPRLDDDGQPIGQVAIRAMNGAEYLAANTAAETSARAQFKDAAKDSFKDSIGYASAYATELRIEQLIRAVRDADDPTMPVFKTAKDIRALLTVEEIAALYLLFLDVTETIGPVINTMTGAELDAWIEKLVEGGETADATGFRCSGQWSALARTMAARIATLRTQLSSYGSPHDDPNENDANERRELHSMPPTDPSEGAP